MVLVGVSSVSSVRLMPTAKPDSSEGALALTLSRLEDTANLVPSRAETQLSVSY